MTDANELITDMQRAFNDVLLNQPEDCRDANAAMTAAYNAIREKLEPVAYAEIGGESGMLYALWPKPHPETQTPLYALPEIKP